MHTFNVIRGNRANVLGSVALRPKPDGSYEGRAGIVAGDPKAERHLGYGTGITGIDIRSKRLRLTR